MMGYRLYRSDRSGHFSSAEILSAESDASALKAAADLRRALQVSCGSMEN
jgi:hypothetical protein